MQCFVSSISGSFMKSGKKSYGYYPYYYYKYPGGLEIPVGFQWVRLRMTRTKPSPLRHFTWLPKKTLETCSPGSTHNSGHCTYVFSANHDDNVEAEDSAKSVRQRPAELIATHEARELLDEQEDFFTIFEKFLPRRSAGARRMINVCARIVHLWRQSSANHKNCDTQHSLFMRLETYLDDCCYSPLATSV